jgi:hypothetical protein
MRSEDTIQELKKAAFWVLRRVTLVRTDVSEELSTPFIRVTKIGGLGTTLAGGAKFLRNVSSYKSHAA